MLIKHAIHILLLVDLSIAREFDRPTAKNPGYFETLSILAVLYASIKT